MNKPTRPVEWLVWGALGLTIAGIVAAFIWKQAGEWNRGEPLPVLFQVPDFTLTNQSAWPVTLADLRGQIWLADIIFTRCAGPCPEMTRKMSLLQAALPANAPVKLISLTTDPGHDTPPVLQAYAQRFGAQAGRWHFLTGTKPQIARVAIDGLKLTALDQEPARQTSDTDLFIHSTTLVLVDGRGRVRASFETDQADSHEHLLAAVQKLLREK